MSELVPTIDMGAFLKDELPSESLKALDLACRNHGFFFISNHGLESLIDDVWNQSHSFFGLDRETKRSVQRTEDNALGFYDRELTKRARDQKEVFDFSAPGDHSVDLNLGESRWPQGMDQFENTLSEYQKACSQLAKDVLVLLFAALGLNRQEVPKSICENHSSFCRLNYYPVNDPLTSDEQSTVASLGDMALHHHTDPGVVTLLIQDDVGGLQTETTTGEWIDIEPSPGKVVVNVSDMLQVVTNDQYRASVHRVLPVPGRDRYSVAYICMPDPGGTIEVAQPLAQPVSLYRPFTWEEFINARISDNYADVGSEEIQIADFKYDVN